MEEYAKLTSSPQLEEQVRELGFDPSHLTPEECEELIEIQLLLADEALNA